MTEVAVSGGGVGEDGPAARDSSFRYCTAPSEGVRE